MAAYLVETFKKTDGIDLKKDVQAMQRIREAAEKAKIELSSMSETNINLPFIVVERGETCLLYTSEMALGMINQKTTAVRIIPAIGKDVGDQVEFLSLIHI